MQQPCRSSLSLLLLSTLYGCPVVEVHTPDDAAGEGESAGEAYANDAGAAEGVANGGPGEAFQRCLEAGGDMEKCSELLEPPTGEDACGGSVDGYEPCDGMTQSPCDKPDPCNDPMYPDCGGDAAPTPEDCWARVIEVCAELGLSDWECKDLAAQKCAIMEPPPPPEDCVGQVLEACAELGLDDAGCKDLVARKCEVVDPGPAPDDCVAQVREYCASQMLSDEECTDLATQKCEWQAPEPMPADPYTECVNSGRDPAVCKEALL